MAAASKIAVTPPGDQPRLALYPAGQRAGTHHRCFPEREFDLSGPHREQRRDERELRFPVADPQTAMTSLGLTSYIRSCGANVV